MFASIVLAFLLLPTGFVFLGPASHSAKAQPQDTVQVIGTTLVSGDSVEARQLLASDLAPTSHHWARLQDSTKRFAAARTLFQIGRLAYPSSWTDSVLAFLREAGANHPDPEVRTEFLYGGLQVAESAERDQAQQRFYKRLVGNHEGSHYAEEAQRLFAPGSNVQAGKELPEFRLPKLSDSTKTFARRDFEGKTFLIDFWGTWCPPCVRAMPHLHEAYRTYGGEDFTILSIAMRDARPAVKKFRSGKWEMPWNHAFVPKESDLQRQLRSRFDISSFPMAVLVGPDGKILQVHRGVGSGKEIARAIQKVMDRED